MLAERADRQAMEPRWHDETPSDVAPFVTLCGAGSGATPRPRPVACRVHSDGDGGGGRGRDASLRRTPALAPRGGGVA